MKVIYIDILVRWMMRRIFSWPIPMPIKVPITLYLLSIKSTINIGLVMLFRLKLHKPTLQRYRQCIVVDFMERRYTV